jgi:hypothetical protein
MELARPGINAGRCSAFTVGPCYFAAKFDLIGITHLGRMGK